MHYISNYLPENVLDLLEANTNFGEIEDIKYVSKLTEEKSYVQFNDSDVLPTGKSSHFQEKNSSNIQFRNSSDPLFRNSSDIKIEKKPCGCMANKIKETPSS